MKIHQRATAALAAGFAFCVVTTVGCTSSTYSVELPAPAPSVGAPTVAGGIPSDASYDIQALTQAVNWDKMSVAAVTEGF